jgi:peroxiredoxin
MSELHGLQTRITEFESEGTRVIAVSPDPVDKNLEVARRLELSYPILSDPDLELTGLLGLVHEGASMDGKDVPRPATFIIENGRIVWRDLTDNWRVRIRADELLEALRDVTGA